MEIIAAGKKILFILIYQSMNWFIAYRDRPRPAVITAMHYTLKHTTWRSWASINKPLFPCLQLHQESLQVKSAQASSL